ncbi:MAG: hypothetical protein GY941_03170 [Planctomycetes bacterium]|nr:hypothetical protein [Planctomycetota bacterium]
MYLNQAVDLHDKTTYKWYTQSKLNGCGLFSVATIKRLCHVDMGIKINPLDDNTTFPQEKMESMANGGSYTNDLIKLLNGTPYPVHVKEFEAKDFDATLLKEISTSTPLLITWWKIFSDEKCLTHTTVGNVGFHLNVCVGKRKKGDSYIILDPTITSKSFAAVI